MNTFADSLTEADKTNPEKIEKAFKKYCGSVKVDTKEHRLCYYVGALETSATYSVGDLSKPLAWGIPAEKICRERLFKSNPQICDLKYGQWLRCVLEKLISVVWWCLEKQIDVNAVDLSKLKVKDLKKILSDWGETADFIEKSEFIKRINEVKEKYVKPAADAIKKDLWCSNVEYMLVNWFVSLERERRFIYFRLNMFRSKLTEHTRRSFLLAVTFVPFVFCALSVFSNIENTQNKWTPTVS